VCLYVKVVLLLVTTSASCALGCGLWETMVGFKFQAYLPWERFVPGSVLAAGNATEFHVSGPVVLALLNFVAYIITLSSLIPISLYVRYFTSCSFMSPVLSFRAGCYICGLRVNLARLSHSALHHAIIHEVTTRLTH